MSKKTIKQKIIILIIFIILIFNFNTALASSQWTNPTDNLQVKIPGLTFSDIKQCDGNADKLCVPWIGEYIVAVYRYAIGVVGILAVIVMMLGGVRWLTAGGSAERIGDAKAWIGAALAGMVLVFGSYLVLYQINPNLTIFKPIEIKKIEGETEIIGCCSGIVANEYPRCYSETRTECEQRKKYNAKMWGNFTFSTGICDKETEKCIKYSGPGCCYGTNQYNGKKCFDYTFLECSTLKKNTPNIYGSFSWVEGECIGNYCSIEVHDILGESSGP